MYRFVHSVLLEFQIGQPLIDFMFVLVEISSKFPLLYYVLEISPIMLHAFQPLLCLKLCWHNRLKPNLEEKSGTQAGV